MPKKIVIALLLLVLIASLYGYFKFFQHPQEPTSIKLSSSIEILPKEINNKEFEDNNTSIIQAETSVVNTNISATLDDKKPKPVDSLEVLGTITNQNGEAIAGVLIYGNGEFPPIRTDANGQYHIVFQKLGFADLLLNLSVKGYERQKSLITINDFEKSPVLNWDLTLTEAPDTQSTTSFGGKISNLNGAGLANRRIRLITLGDSSEKSIRFIEVAQTDKNGHFVLGDISINTKYKFMVLADDKYSGYIVNEILVTNDTPDLDIILEHLKFINKLGLVIDREGVPMANLKLSANSNANGNINDKYSRNLMTDYSGGFQLENFPEGEVSFSIESPAKIKITGINLSEMDSETIILTVDSGNHFLSGLVSDSDGQIIENARVTLQSTYSKNGIDSHAVRSVTTDSMGAFTFDNFGADEHILSVMSMGFKQKMIVHQPHSSATNLNIILERR